VGAGRHALWASGHEAEALTGLPKLMRTGSYAVDLFIMISGFIIVLSLDKQREWSARLSLTIRHKRSPMI
jgi:peptidoglycan/LPS O-acetylase OafA/YrhL